MPTFPTHSKFMTPQEEKIAALESQIDRLLEKKYDSEQIQKRNQHLLIEFTELIRGIHDACSQLDDEEKAELTAQDLAKNLRENIRKFMRDYGVNL
jgi:predicted transcriptional regulator